MKILTTITLFLACLVSQAQTSVVPTISTSFYIPDEKTIFYKLGDRTLPIQVQQYGDATDVVLINLHSNESTSVAAAKQVLSLRGGTLIRIDNGIQRTIRFRFRGVTYVFDPNRIFSREGIEQSLKESGRTHPLAVDEIEKFAKRVLELIPENVSCIIALHNNTNQHFSVKSYLPGADRSRDAAAVYENPEQDADDIALTTDSLVYQFMAESGFNSILQDNIQVKKDGSMSVWSGENGKRYINIETEHGREEQYRIMLDKFLEFLARKKEE